MNNNTFDNKATIPKAAIKRNLFGEQNEDEITTTLAQQLSESPRCRSSCTTVLSPTIQSAKCNEFGYETQEIVTGEFVIMHSVQRIN